MHLVCNKKAVQWIESLSVFLRAESILYCLIAKGLSLSSFTFFFLWDNFEQASPLFGCLEILVPKLAFISRIKDTLFARWHCMWLTQKPVCQCLSIAADPLLYRLLQCQGHFSRFVHRVFCKHCKLPVWEICQQLFSFLSSNHWKCFIMQNLLKCQLLINVFETFQCISIICGHNTKWAGIWCI